MSPRTRLQNDKSLASNVQNMVDGGVFDAASEAALANLVMQCKRVGTIEEAAQAYNRIVGAVEYLTAIQTIADVPKPSPSRLSDNLNHKV